MGRIELLNFSRDEVDSTFLIFYEKETDFKIVEDSILIDISAVSSNIIFGQSTRNISIDYDYQLCFTTIKKTYKISGFRTSKAECNDCFPRKDYYTKVDGYEIDGIYKEYSTIQIDQLLD